MASSSAFFRVKPYVTGLSTARRTILRTRDAPHYLSVSTAERKILEPLQDTAISVEAYFAEHLGGRNGLRFNEAVSLLLRLHAAGFLDSTADKESLRQLAALTEATAGRAGIGQRLLGWQRWLDLPLLHLIDIGPSRFLTVLGKILLSPFGLAALATILALHLWQLGAPEVALRRALGRALESPERFLPELAGALTLAASFLCLAQAAMLGALGARFIPGSVRLTLLLFVRLEISDDDALIAASRSRFTRYHLVNLALPWALGALTLKAALVRNLGYELNLVAAAFAVLGTLALCPLVRSPALRLVEGWLAVFDLLRAGNIYLHHGLFKSLLGDSKRVGLRAGDLAFEWAVIGFASLSMTWLYLVSLLCSRGLLAVIPALLTRASMTVWPGRAVASAILLALLFGALIFCVLRLVLIPLQNIASVVALPLRRARRSLARSGNSAEVAAFLADIPVFSTLGDEQRRQIAGKMSCLEVRPNAPIIEQGEIGDEFYVLASGRAEIVRDDGDGREAVVNTLGPGDAFGEVALIERCRRTASVRATERSVVYFLGRQDFDPLFPPGSEARAQLTPLLRQTKLILDSQALSHLGSLQIRELLRHAVNVQVAAGEKIVSEGDVGTSVWLLAEGKATVRHAREIVAHLNPGDLIGIISLVKGGGRTADVIADSAIRCLRFDGAVFLKICLANPVVALLIADLSDKQSGELRKGA